MDNTQQNNSFNVVAPNATFQTTSTMMGSGSTYSANPVIGSDGSATYEGVTYAEQTVPGGPNRVRPTTHENQPIGDGLWILLVLAVGYAAWRRVIARMRQE